MFELIVAYFAACGVGIVLALALPPARQAGVLGWLGCTAAAASAAAGAVALLAGNGFTQMLWSVPGVATLTLRLDPLSALFVLVTGLVLFPASIYAAGELRGGAMRGPERSFTVMLLALYASIVLILIAGDALLFLLAWEVMSILCYLLVVGGRRRENEAQVGSGYLLLAMGEAGTLAAPLGFPLLAPGAGAVGFAGPRAAPAGVGAGALAAPPPGASSAPASTGRPESLPRKRAPMVVPAKARRMPVETKRMVRALSGLLLAAGGVGGPPG